MAKRSFYKTDKKLSTRKIILTVAILAAVAGAGYKLFSMHDAETKEIQPDANQQTASLPADPAITLPPKSFSPPANDAQPVQSAGADTIVTINTAGTAAMESAAAVSALAGEQAAKLLEQARQALTAKDGVKARTLLNQAIQLNLPADLDKQARDLNNQAASIWLFSRNAFFEDAICQTYQVQTGDNLKSIGIKYNVPFDFLLRINGITDAAKLRANQNIKVVKGPFHCVVEKSRCRLNVFLDDTLVYTWPVSIGLPGRDTPVGLWKVKRSSKLINPEWTDPDTGKKYLPDDPLNPLGERWIGLDGVEGDAVGRTGFGIHGTIEPEKIGQPASHGCIRMVNNDAETLFDMLIEDKSIVKIAD